MKFMKKQQVRDTLYRELQPLLPGWKLVKKDEGFARAIPGGKQMLGVSLVDYNPEFQFSLVLVTRIDAVEEITNRFSGAPPGPPATTWTSVTQLAYFFPGETDKDYSVRSEADVETVVRGEIATLLRERVLPFLDAHRDVATLDKGLNGGDPRFDTSDPNWRNLSAVIVAWLAGNPRFDELVRSYEAAMQGFPEVSKQRLATVVAHLRANVPRGHAGPNALDN